MKNLFFQRLLIMQLLLAFFFLIGSCDDGESTKPVIAVYQGNVQIENQTGIYDFGSFDFTETGPEIVFTIKNEGIEDLQLTGEPKIAISGADSTNFVVDDSITAKVLVSDVSTTFTVKLAPTVPGIKTATISIENDDAKNSPFTFALKGKITPTYNWTRTINVGVYSYITASETDSHGNYYVTGSYWHYDSGDGSGIDFGEDFGISDLKDCTSSASYITKVNSDGTYGWTRQIEDYKEISSNIRFNNLAVDSIGNIYLIGSFRGFIDFGKDFGVSDVHTSSVSENVFISKITSTGDYIWTKVIGNAGPNNGRAIVCDSDDNVYFTCSFEGTIDIGAPFGTSDVKVSKIKTDTVLTKFDVNGNYLWSKQFSCDDGIKINYISLDKQENVYLSGRFYNVADFGSDFGTTDIKGTIGRQNTFVTKITHDCKYGWTKIFGLGKTDINSIVFDSLNNVYLSGNFNDSVNFGEDFGITDIKTTNPKFEPDTGVYNYDFFILKINFDGSFGWVRQIGNEYSNYDCSITIDSINNINIIGSFRGSLNIGKDFGVSEVLVIPNRQSKIFYTKIKPDGSYCWTLCIGDDIGCTFHHDVATTHTNNIFLIGSFESIDFGKPFGTTDTRSSTGIFPDLFIMKLQG